MDENEKSQSEILPPEEESSQGSSEDVYLALVNNYTDRPDLLIAELEKADPGFVKRMNLSAEAHAERLRDSKYNFGKRQAYSSLVVQVVAALAVLGCLGLAIWKGLGFGTILGLVVFFSVSQSGSFGFAKILNATTKIIEKSHSKDKNQRE